MALKTNVHIRYRTPYMPGVDIPDEQIKIMRSEISNMRKDLLKKQEVLKRSNKYSENERLISQLNNIEVKNLNTNSKVWNTWNRLRNLELSNETSLSGKNKSRAKAIESFHQSGFTGINDKNYDDFTKFMDKVKEDFQALLWDSEQIVDIYLDYYESGELNGMNASERYVFMLNSILDELTDQYRTYDTEDKFGKGYSKTVKELNKTFISKDMLNTGKKKK